MVILMKKIQTIAVYGHIMESEIFRLNGKRIDLSASAISLCEAIEKEHEDEDTSIWNIGEGQECCLSDLITLLYWAFSSCHSGQSSPEYAALSSLGKIYSPGMECQPSKGDDDFENYEMFCNYLLKKV